MASALNVGNCLLLNNTGQPYCGLEPGIAAYLVFVPKGTIIPAAQLTDADTFNTYVQGRLENNTAALRWHKTPLIGNLDDKTGDPATQTLDNIEFTTQFKPYNLTYQFLPGTKCVHSKWKRFNQQQNLWDMFIVDNNGNWWGRTGGTNEMGAYSLTQLTVGDFMQAKPDSIAVYKMYLVLASNIQLNANFVIFPAASDMSTMLGLLDVTLYHNADNTTNTSTHYYVSGTMGCGAQSIGVKYGSTLAVAGAWVIRNITDGLNVTPSAVAYDSVKDEYDFTVSAQTTGDDMSISLGTPSALLAIDSTANLITGVPYLFDSL